MKPSNPHGETVRGTVKNYNDYTVGFKCIIVCISWNYNTNTIILIIWYLIIEITLHSDGSTNAMHVWALRDSESGKHRLKFCKMPVATGTAAPMKDGDAQVFWTWKDEK